MLAWQQMIWVLGLRRSGRVFTPAILALCAAWLTAGPALAQQVTVGTPFQSNSSSYFESYGTQWQVNGPNFFANFGGGAAVPPFGGYDPAAGLQTGWAWQQGNWNGRFSFNAAQGSRISSVTQTPMLTLSNGVPGMIVDQSISPFVVGYTPIVGGINFAPPAWGWAPQPAWSPSWYDPGLSGVGFYSVPADPKLEGSHEPISHRAEGEQRPAATIEDAPRGSVAEARARFTAEERVRDDLKRHSLEDKLSLAEAAIADQKYAVARVYLKQAAKLATGPEREAIVARLNGLPTD